MSLKAAAAASASRRRRRTAGGIAGWKRARTRGRRCRACSIARAVRVARRGSSRPSSRKRSVSADARQAGGRGSIAGATGLAHSTVWKALKRAGISRPPRPTREPANRYEWPCPGDLLHMDVSEYVRFKRPGHRVTGDRSSQDHQHATASTTSTRSSTTTPASPTPRSIHDARAATVAGFLERALAFYTAHGISPNG